jgi:hypothetical protein
VHARRVQIRSYKDAAVFARTPSAAPQRAREAERPAGGRPDYFVAPPQPLSLQDASLHDD